MELGSYYTPAEIFVQLYTLVTAPKSQVMEYRQAWCIFQEIDGH